MNGYIGWQASPSSVVRPTDHRGSGSRSNKAQMKQVSAAAMMRRTCGCQPSKATSRHQPAISNTAGELRLLLAEQPGAHYRVDAIGADQYVDRDAGSIVKPGPTRSPRSK